MKRNGRKTKENVGNKKIVLAVFSILFILYLADFVSQYIVVGITFKKNFFPYIHFQNIFLIFLLNSIDSSMDLTLSYILFLSVLNLSKYPLLLTTL